MRRFWQLFPLVLVFGGSFGLARYAQGQEPPLREPRASVHIPGNALAFRVLLGRGDKVRTDWSGSVEVPGGSLLRVEGWRFRQDDAMTGPTAWHAFSRRQQPRAGAARPAQQANANFLPASVVVTVLPAAGQEIRITTPKGNFVFRPSEVPFGEQVAFLNGAAAVERVFPDFSVGSSRTEDDYPSAAVAPDGTIWVAYVAYRYGTGDDPNLRGSAKEPESFEFLRPKGNGDEIRLARIKPGGEWTDVAALTEPGLDLYRPAVGVDGSGAVWTVWPQNDKGNWDLYGRRFRNGALDRSPVRLTREEGPDLQPALARDAKGSLWLAWQGFRGDTSDIFLSSLRSGTERWSRPERISPSPRNDWDPQVACAPDGSVYVAWDTYDKGDYDVMLRRLANGRLEAPIAVADTPKFEARASLVCDAQNRAWVAWEEGSENWGKDFGYVVRDNAPGTPLYRDHSVQVRCFTGGQRQRTAGEIGRPAPARRPRANGTIGNQARAGAQLQASFPRLGLDRAGRVYLTYRRTLGELRTPYVGSAWLSYVTRFEGSDWSSPVMLPDSDAELDNRPALVTSGTLYMIHVTDGRNRPTLGDARHVLAVSPLDPGSETTAPAAALVADPAPAGHPIDAHTTAELTDIDRVHQFRPAVGGKSYLLMRGDWHRHTEISPDGGGDGPLIDLYRYALDAAGMDWMCAQDHDNGNGREYTWWQIQKLCDLFHVGNRSVPLFGYERSVRYPDGHRNVMFSYRGVRPLPRLTGGQGNGVSTEDTKMLYKYLRYYHGICSSHTSATDMGTDWRDNDPALEPVVEIYQGDRNNYEYEGAPRSNNAQDSPGGFQPAGFVWNAFSKGYRLGFQSSSDHISTHMSYGIAYTEKPTREAILDAFRKRHTYGATDNIVLEVRSGDHLMGDEFESRKAPELTVHVEGTGPIARLIVVKDNKVVYTSKADRRDVDLAWIDNEAKAGTSYYYVRVEQQDGQLAWASPMWITYRP